MSETTGCIGCLGIIIFSIALGTILGGSYCFLVMGGLLILSALLNHFGDKE
jgi:hypothetical protein